MLFNRKKTGKGHFVRANKAVFKELWCNPDNGVTPFLYLSGFFCFTLSIVSISCCSVGMSNNPTAVK